MGLLLAFMFLVNMFGALILLPSLAAFLLPGTKNKGEAPQSVRMQGAEKECRHVLKEQV
ncbi:hypothetical protein D3C81_2230480 [compost metagenome]